MKIQEELNQIVKFLEACETTGYKPGVSKAAINEAIKRIKSFDAKENLFSENKILFSTSGDESTDLKISTNNNTGVEKIWLTYRKAEVLPHTKENMELLKSKFKKLNPSSGWCLSIDEIIQFINKGNFTKTNE